jgi:hypothetical protein
MVIVSRGQLVCIHTLSLCRTLLYSLPSWKRTMLTMSSTLCSQLSQALFWSPQAYYRVLVHVHPGQTLFVKNPVPNYFGHSKNSQVRRRVQCFVNVSPYNVP